MPPSATASTAVVSAISRAASSSIILVAVSLSIVLETVSPAITMVLTKSIPMISMVSLFIIHLIIYYVCAQCTHDFSFRYNYFAQNYGFFVNLPNNNNSFIGNLSQFIFVLHLTFINASIKKRSFSKLFAKKILPYREIFIPLHSLLKKGTPLS